MWANILNWWKRSHQNHHTKQTAKFCFLHQVRCSVEILNAFCKRVADNHILDIWLEIAFYRLTQFISVLHETIIMLFIKLSCWYLVFLALSLSTKFLIPILTTILMMLELELCLWWGMWLSAIITQGWSQLKVLETSQGKGWLGNYFEGVHIRVDLDFKIDF